MIYIALFMILSTCAILLILPKINLALSYILNDNQRRFILWVIIIMTIIISYKIAR